MRRRRGGALAPILLGAAGCAVSSWLTIPLDPVPITLQTFAVTLAGALLGAGRGATAVLVWLAAGALGAPVLAGGTGGIDRFAGASAGFLFAFPVAAWLVGHLVARGWARHIVALFGVMVIGNLACLAIGAAWLAMSLGAAAAIAKGVLPFLPGALLKAIAATVVFVLVRRRRPA